MGLDIQPILQDHGAMANKRKRRPADPPELKPAPAGPFHPAFAGLKQAWAQTIPSIPAGPPAPEPPPPAPTEAEEDESVLLARAMAQVRPLATRRRQREPEPQPRSCRLEQAPDEDLEVLASLADLVSGAAELDIRLTEQYVQGHLPGVGPELMERLSDGEFPIQDHLDMHGLGLVEARGELEGFLVAAQARGLRHVLVVHGRGLGSPDGVPVLKQALGQWLTTKSLRKRVLAFCSALPRDGGAGAMYLLLRKQRAPGSPRW
jgi:DNA-nicking Smr family endonuclease